MQIDSRNWNLLVSNGLFRYARPLVSRGNQEALCKAMLLLFFIEEALVRNGYERIQAALFNSVFLKKLALDGPIFAVVGLRHQIDSRILRVD